MLRLNNILAQPGSHRSTKRLGRGPASGQGKTAGKGHKGQKARKSGPVRPGFEGGQTPLYRRLPKRGFKNFTRRDKAVFNVGDLEALGASIKDITLEALQAAGLVEGHCEKLAILGDGELKRAVQVTAHKISESAKAKIAGAGGSAEVIPVPGGLKARQAAERKKRKSGGAGKARA